MNPDVLSVLKNSFGFDSFRPGQEGLIDAVLSGRDVLGIMPTGAGKSLCFQLPALLLPGTTVVISPLISLMKAQVEALHENGIPAAVLNSTLTQQEYGRTLYGLREGRYKLLYVAPERLEAEGFLACLSQVAVPFVTVDEAHCVSQWGQDFRPSYLRIRDFLASIPARPAVAAFTATATAQVARDIVRLLDLREPEIVRTGYDRENLYFAVETPRDKLAAVKAYVRQRSSRSGIVYCSTRKAVEQVCEELCGAGIRATRYHAGLDEEERRQNQEDFLCDLRPVMVATNAFGMGIDKSNVSYVVHFNMPKDLESYYQEAGRAGRDGERAECMLFFSGRDVAVNQFLIDNSNDELEPDVLEEVRRKSRERLRKMTGYCHTGECLRAYILHYFGEMPLEHCGNCGNCLQETQEEDITTEAQKVLSCVKRAGERFGAVMIVDVLRGAQNERIRTRGLDRLSTYGIMKGDSAARVRSIVDHLLLTGFLRATDDQYPVLRLTPLSGEVLFRGQRVMMRTVVRAAEQPARKAAGEGEERPELYERLRRLRARIAGAQSVPAYIVFTDATLHAMCRILPQNRDDLLEVPGVGGRKLERYGDLFLTEIRQYLQDT